MIIFVKAMDSLKNILNPDQWVDSYGDELYSYAIKRVFSQAVAEDVVQDTFLAALGSMKNFKGKSSEKTWLFAILKNKLVDHFRKLNTKKEEYVNFTMPFKESGLFYKHWDKSRAPGNWSFDPKDSLEAEDFKRIFKWCLTVLPPKLASVFAMKMIEDCESDEICKEVGITSSNFWVMMHRARLKLRECIQNNWLEMPSIKKDR
jgi:RNA polymerase sigma-70 factor (ECF subfamily)